MCSGFDSRTFAQKSVHGHRPEVFGGVQLVCPPGPARCQRRCVVAGLQLRSGVSRACQAALERGLPNWSELIELALKLQRPTKTSRTSSQPLWTNRRGRREQF